MFGISDICVSCIRQYALLLNYFQYCQHMVDLDVPTTILHSLLLDEQDGEDMTLFKVCASLNMQWLYSSLVK